MRGKPTDYEAIRKAFDDVREEYPYYNITMAYDITAQRMGCGRTTVLRAVKTAEPKFTLNAPVKPAKKVCPQCGTELREEAIFCDHCGAKYLSPGMELFYRLADATRRCAQRMQCADGDFVLKAINDAARYIKEREENE